MIIQKKYGEIQFQDFAKDLPKLPKKHILKKLTSADLADKSDKDISNIINNVVKNKDILINFLLNGVSKMTTQEIDTFLENYFYPLLKSIITGQYKNYISLGKVLLTPVIKSIASN